MSISESISGRWMRSLVGIGGSLLVALVALPAMSQDAAEAPASAADANPPPPKRWEASLALGGSLRSGDENRYSGNANGMLKRLWDRDTATWTAFGDYGKTGGKADVNDFGTGLEWRHQFSGRLFWLSNFGADHDAIQARNVRIAVYTGPGYRIWEADAEKRYFDVNSGLGYRHESFAGDTPDNDLFDLRTGYEYKDVIGKVLEIEQKTNLYTPLNEIRNFLAHAELTLSVPLVGSLYFRNSARYEFVNEPADGKEHSNFWLTIGLEYKL